MIEQRNAGGWCQCADCGRRFSGLRGFDLHRTDAWRDPFDWRCATDDEFAEAGMRQDPRGWWVRPDGRSTRRERTESA